jgi:hypothetical protein
MLPNAERPWPCDSDQQPGWLARRFKSSLEWLLSGRFGDKLEAWEMRRKLRKFEHRLARSGGNAILDRDHVKGHFDDYGEPVMRLYAERVAQLEL